MKLLLIAHNYARTDQRKPLYYLSQLPDVELDAVAPCRWQEGGSVAHTELGQFDTYPLHVLHPVVFRQHIHSYPPISRILRELEPDIVYLREEPFSLVTALTLRAMQRICPSARGVFHTSLDDDRDLSRMPGVRRILFPRALRTSFEIADMAIGVSDKAADQMRKRGFEGPVTVVPNGTEVQDLERPTEDEIRLLRRDLHLDESYVIGYVGRLVHWKAVDLLVRAFAELNEPTARLLIVGDGDQRSSIEAQAGTLGVSDRVVMTGAVPFDKVREYMSVCDVVVLPSRTDAKTGVTEKFGRAIIEAMALNVPVIGSSSGGIPKVIGDNGFIFREDDCGHLVDRLRQVIDLAESERHALRQRAYGYVLERFDYERIANELYTNFSMLLR